jgi:hypothetical protein
MSSTRILTAVAAVALLGVASAPAGARKDPRSGEATQPYSIPLTCDAAGMRVFEQFRDRRSYTLVPGGDFEAATDGWTFDGAEVVDGSEPFGIGGVAGAKSLSLPAGSSATSPKVCVTRAHPMFRFVARKASGDRKARLRVEVVYATGKGRKSSRTAGKLRAGDEWRPTRKLAIAIGRALSKGRNGSGEVSFRFTPVGQADWQIDAVYVDPRARR